MDHGASARRDSRVGVNRTSAAPSVKAPVSTTARHTRGELAGYAPG